MKFDNLEAVYDFIQDIGAADGRNEKERLLALFLQDETAKRVVDWAYNPFITFGITPPEKVDRNTKAKGDLAWIEPLLVGLSTREYTGSDAAVRVQEALEALSPNASELLRRILIKDLRCGIAASSINKALPGMIPVFGVMRAHSFEEKRIKHWPVAVEPKMDGFRGVWLNEQDPAIYTRSGNVMNPAQGLANDINAALPSTSFDRGLIAIDGEVMSGDFNKTSGDLRRKSASADDAVFHIFDVFRADVFAGATPPPYSERRAQVMKLVAELKPILGDRVVAAPSYFANSVEEVMGYYERFRARGFEGAMVKKLDGTYKAGKSHDWLKIKAEETEDLIIKDAFPGEPGTKYADCLGGVIVDRQGVDVRVGGGFSDDQRKKLWDDYLHDVALRETNAALLLTEGKLLGRMIEVEYHEVTKDGSLRHPRFKRFRDDKAGEAKLDAMREAAE